MAVVSNSPKQSATVIQFVKHPVVPVVDPFALDKDQRFDIHGLLKSSFLTYAGIVLNLYDVAILLENVNKNHEMSKVVT